LRLEELDLCRREWDLRLEEEEWTLSGCELSDEDDELAAEIGDCGTNCLITEMG
jgi:chaperonin cofactor prefoldin